MIRRICLIILISVSTGVLSYSQSGISGIVKKQSTGEPIPYVNIAISGKNIGTVSNQNGVFNLNYIDLDVGDSLGFYYVGLKPVLIPYNKLENGMEIKMEELVIAIDEISVLARTYKGRELLKLALARKDSNYARSAQQTRIFRRRNNATTVDLFDLVLDKSTIPSIDDDFAQAIEDSMIKYSRNYTDHLYEVYYKPGDSLYPYGKSQGIKHIKLDEEIGGEFEQIEKRLEVLFNENEKGVFWKIKTGPIGGKLNDPDETEEEKAAAEIKSLEFEKRRDSIRLHQPHYLHEVRRLNSWQWEFLSKPGRYNYKTTGIVNIQGENCYEVSFKGGLNTDYQGKLYISSDTFAILKIEYQLKNRKADNSLKILGVHYNEPDDTGILIYEKDASGYYLKYSMELVTTQFRLMRPFQLIQKTDKGLFNRRINKISTHINMSVSSEERVEFLVVNRNPLSQVQYDLTKPVLADIEEVTEYSEDIWKGYSIIEPTKQMKEYRVKTKDTRRKAKD